MLSLNGTTVNVNQFPNGESFADVDKELVKKDYNRITLRYESDVDILFLQFLKDFVDDHAPNSFVSLNLPYIPYSRMDRQEESRLFTLKSFAKMLNRMNFQEVNVMEPHSEVSVALIDRVNVLNTSAFLAVTTLFDILDVSGTAWFHSNPIDFDGTPQDYTLAGLFDRAQKAGVYFVYPDAGAEKRYRKQIKYPNIITCSKVRDFNTGNIKSIKINEVSSIKDCKVAVIVDDLSSKGGTFIGSAKALREAIPTLEKVILVVTHCENTILEGDVLTGSDIDAVYTTNSIFTKIESAESVTSYYVGKCRYKVGKMIIETVDDVTNDMKLMR